MSMRHWTPEVNDEQMLYCNVISELRDVGEPFRQLKPITNAAVEISFDFTSDSMKSWHGIYKPIIKRSDTKPSHWLSMT